MQSSKRILNLGCGNQFYGTDRLDILPSQATTLICDVEDGLPYSNCVFDEVYTQNLFEHIKNPGFFLRECYRVLKVNGNLILVTDNAACQRFYLFGTHEGRYERKHDPKDKHYSIYTRSHLRNHLQSVGFKILESTLVNTDTIGKWMDKFTGQKPRIMVVATK